MYHEKGRIILSTGDLDLVSKCPYSITMARAINSARHCVRCNAFSEIARYCFSRAFRETNAASDKRLKEKYNDILLGEGVGKEAREAMIRQDSGILIDLLYLSREYKNNIDQVEPEITINLGSFSIRDSLDAILCIKERYFIATFMCDDHPVDDRDMLGYQVIAGSLWIRENYSVEDNGVCLVRLRRAATPIMRYVDILPSTENLKSSIEDSIKCLEFTSQIKNEHEFQEYKIKLKQLSVRPGNINCLSHCSHCYKW